MAPATSSSSRRARARIVAARWASRHSVAVLGLVRAAVPVDGLEEEEEKTNENVKGQSIWRPWLAGARNAVASGAKMIEPEQSEPNQSKHKVSEGQGMGRGKRKYQQVAEGHSIGHGRGHTAVLSEDEHYRRGTCTAGSWRVGRGKGRRTAERLPAHVDLLEEWVLEEVMTQINQLRDNTVEALTKIHAAIAIRDTPSQPTAVDIGANLVAYAEICPELFPSGNVDMQNMAASVESSPTQYLGDQPDDSDYSEDQAAANGPKPFFTITDIGILMCASQGQRALAQAMLDQYWPLDDEFDPRDLEEDSQSEREWAAMEQRHLSH